MDTIKDKSFGKYLKEGAYWLGFKSPRWTLFLLPLIFFLKGVDEFILGEVVVLILLYFNYHKGKNK